MPFLSASKRFGSAGSARRLACAAACDGKSLQSSAAALDGGLEMMHPTAKAKSIAIAQRGISLHHTSASSQRWSVFEMKPMRKLQSGPDLTSSGQANMREK